MSLPNGQRRGHSFHKSFLAEDFRRSHARDWSLQWDGLQGPELCAQMVLTVHKSLFGRLWHNGRRSSSEISGHEAPTSAIETLAQYKVRAFPETAAIGLSRWARGEVELQVFNGLPLPEEILGLQAQGIRCISVLTKPSDIETFQHEGRDFFSFMVHDLIHAQLMTADAESYRHQIKFALWLKAEWHDLIQGLNVEGRRQLEYMASDMNSHIIHLLKTFKSWVQRHRPELLERTRWLKAFAAADDSLEVDFQRYWLQLNEARGANVDDLHRGLLHFWQRLPVQVISVD